MKIAKLMSHNIVINNPYLNLVTIRVYTQFGLILSIQSQEIERKPNKDRMTMTGHPV